MKDKKEKIKAVAMLSGGLDSSLAVKIVADQGIDVVGINYNTGFCMTDHRRKMASLGAGIAPESVRNEALRAGARWRIPVEIIDISEEYMDILTRPKYGYGKAINPCIDCRIFMLKKTAEYMEKIGARFIITGEVLGQRPMSQMRNTLRLIEKQSGCAGLILRPLSAKKLKPTIPEIKGWVDREKLYDFSGRSRKEQIKLALELGLDDYPQPAGGCCFLTDRNYARRMEDLFKYEGNNGLNRNQVILLKVGRHFRISEKVKIVVGRNEVENTFLSQQADDLTQLYCLDENGPLTLLEGTPGEEEICLAARVTARYSDSKALDSVKVKVEFPENESKILQVQPLDSISCEKLRI
ncbi:MAG TPA: hypothetical protein VM123_16730 [archaeon]|nr:hypothetical protein [archaeon]